MKNAQNGKGKKETTVFWTHNETADEQKDRKSTDGRCALFA